MDNRQCSNYFWQCCADQALSAIAINSAGIFHSAWIDDTGLANPQINISTWNGISWSPLTSITKDIIPNPKVDNIFAFSFTIDN